MISSTSNVIAGQIIAIVTLNADSISVGGISTTANGSVVFVVIFCDSKGNVVGTLAPLTLLSGASPDWGPTSAPVYLGIPDTDREPSIHCSGDVTYLLIQSVVGTWTISAEARWLPGVTQPF